MVKRNARQECRELERWVRDEYVEMPGQRLTAAQASRLWAVHETLSSEVLNGLVARGFLRCVGPYYFRADYGHRRA